MAESVLVFDVNETLIDIESIAPIFERIFGDSAVLRTWFSQLLAYSMTVTASGHYVDFFTLGQGILRMFATTYGVDISDDDEDALKHALLTMPAHPDAMDALTRLHDNGFRLFTLTNSPPNPFGPSPIEHAGLGHLFERQFSIDACQAFKPASAPYLHVCDQLGLAPAECMMVAAHAWDIIGAQSVGFSGALITRPGNAALPVAGLPEPTVIASDLRDLADKLTNRGASASTG